jgi:predicted outer membrane lipoprotein
LRPVVREPCAGGKSGKYSTQPYCRRQDGPPRDLRSAATWTNASDLNHWHGWHTSPDKLVPDVCLHGPIPISCQRGMIDRVNAIMTLASVVLGAVLALAGGIVTERWKEHREARAAARLVWLELRLGYTSLLGVVALEKWPTKFLFSDDAWTAQRDRLALVRSAKEFQELQDAYLILGTLTRASPDDLSEPVLYWPALVMVDRAFCKLGEAAGIEREQLDQYRAPLQKRVADLCANVAQLNATPEVKSKLMNDAIAKALDDFPAELRARATEAFARERSVRPTTNGPREPVSGGPEPNP